MYIQCIFIGLSPSGLIEVIIHEDFLVILTDTTKIDAFMYFYEMLTERRFLD